MKQELARKEKAFYPEYLSEIFIVIFLTIFVVFVLSMIYGPLVGREINFVSAYQPKPEWYFLWIYQLVRYFPGPWAFAGAVIIPVLVVALFIATPFIDKGTRWTGRIAAFSLAALGAFILVMTLLPVFRP